MHIIWNIQHIQQFVDSLVYDGGDLGLTLRSSTYSLYWFVWSHWEKSYSAATIVNMMKLDDSRNARLLDPSTQYASLETSMQMFELVLPLFRRLKSWSRFYAISACIALISVAAIVSGITVRGGRNPSKDHHVLRDHRKLSPGPSPVQNSDIGDGWTTSFHAPAVETLSKPVSSALRSPESSPTPSSSLYLSSSPLPVEPAPQQRLDSSMSGQIYDRSRYKIICNKTM